MFGSGIGRWGGQVSKQAGFENTYGKPEFPSLPSRDELFVRYIHLQANFVMYTMINPFKLEFVRYYLMNVGVPNTL